MMWRWIQRLFCWHDYVVIEKREVVQEAKSCYKVYTEYTNMCPKCFKVKQVKI